SFSPHGMGGVGAEIHDDLLHLGRIRKHESRLALEVRPDLYGAGERGPEELEGLPDHRGALERQFLLLRLSAEGEDLLDELPAADTRGEDALHVPPDRRSLGALVYCYFRKADDSGKDVVEVVGYATGERPDRLHLVGLTEQGFGLLAFFSLDPKAFVSLLQFGGPLLH